MRAIILAAGQGARLRPYTSDVPKCFVELGGRPLILHQVEALLAAGVDDLYVVTGYRAEAVERLGFKTCRNDRHAETNMVASLMCAANLLDGSDDVIIAYGDLLYEPRIIQALASCQADLGTTVDSSWERLWRLRLEDPLSDAETLLLDDSGFICDLGRKPHSYDDIQGQYMGITRMSAAVCPEVVGFYRQLDPTAMYDGKDFDNMYMTTFLRSLIDAGYPIQAVPVNGGWLEVDSADDLELYRRMLEEGRLAEYWCPDTVGVIG